MADTKLKVGDVTFTPAELSKTYQTYRKELIVQPMLAMDKLLQHCSVRTGIRYRETVTEMSGTFEIGNYKKDKKQNARKMPPSMKIWRSARDRRNCRVFVIMCIASPSVT